jgi:hypothetical protein
MRFVLYLGYNCGCDSLGASPVSISLSQVICVKCAFGSSSSDGGTVQVNTDYEHEFDGLLYHRRMIRNRCLPDIKLGAESNSWQ